MTILDDRAFARSIGASCLLHGAALALVLIGWRIDQKPSLAFQPIPVTFVRSADAPTTTLAVPAENDDQLVSPPSPAHSAQATVTTRPRQRTPSHPVPSSPTGAARAHEAKPSPKPSDAITALIGEGVNGEPLENAPAGRDAGIRSSAPVSDDYLVLLASWLARFQSYPEAAAAKRQQGKTVIGFTVTRDGAIQRVWIDQSSGVEALDKASLDMVRAASPVPHPPQNLGAATIDFYFPVNYTLSTSQRLFD